MCIYIEKCKHIKPGEQHLRHQPKEKVLLDAEARLLFGFRF